MFADNANYKIIGNPQEKPEITIAVLTYNHGKYLKQSLDSILNQEIDVNYNIVVADDFSTDGTRQILLEYQQQYPKLFKLIFQNSNSGVYRNGFDLFSNTDGKYVAILEGDDFWTSKYKLRNQLNFMRSNQELVACFHNVDIVDEHAKFIKRVYSDNRSLEIELSDLIKGDYMKTCSLFYRNFSEMAFEITNAGIDLQDTSIGLWLLSKGKSAGYINESMAAYRLHSSGVWSTLNVIQKGISGINLYLSYYKWDLLRSNKKFIKKEAIKRIKHLWVACLKRFDIKNFIEGLKLYSEFK